MSIELFTVGPDVYERNRGDLKKLAAFNRINTLSCIKSAEHGWLGASYSICEIMTSLYFRFDHRNTVLSKGHAAAIQYACLHGLGLIDRDMLLSYKDGPGGLQAHTDRLTPGILVNSGSLGMGVSKTAGLAYYKPEDRFAVIVGDGELQEGQVFEALQTIASQFLDNVTIIIDLNGYQSEFEVAQVKGIADYEQLFRGLGFMVYSFDGHDSNTFCQIWEETESQPCVLLANTIKAGGSRYLTPEDGRQPWHGRVPDDELYLKIVTEQIDIAKDETLIREFAVYREATKKRIKKDKQKVQPKSGVWRIGGPNLQTLGGPGALRGMRKSKLSTGTELPATGRAFSKRIEFLMPSNKSVIVLDADLAQACRLENLQSDERFLEMGISEQDMVSFAGGLALSGKLPIVNTYAAFLKRAYEQMYVNATEGAKIIYAGHYAGLCYFTDGKTHQSLNDLAVMSTLPGTVVVEPVTLRQTELLVDWAVGAQPDSVYFRLRRTPAILDLPEHKDWRPDKPIVAKEFIGKCSHWFITTGTVSTQLAQDIIAKDDYNDWGMAVQSVFNGPIDYKFWQDILAKAEVIVTIEEDFAPGTLFSFMSRLVNSLDITPRLLAKTLDGVGASFRTLQECCDYFGYTVENLEEQLKERGFGVGEKE